MKFVETIGDVTRALLTIEPEIARKKLQLPYIKSIFEPPTSFNQCVSIARATRTGTMPLAEYAGLSPTAKSMLPNNIAVYLIA